MQEGGDAGLRVGGQHQVLPGVLGHQLEEEAESPQRVLLRPHAAQVASAG